MIADAQGNPTAKNVLLKSSAFSNLGDTYFYFIMYTSKLAPGTYAVTIYGNAFVAQQVQFRIIPATQLK